MIRTALVLGDAACVWIDAEEALKLFTPDAVAATNNIGIRWKGRVDFWCSLHPGLCADWLGMADALGVRHREGRNRPETWGHRAVNGIDNRTSDWGGSTGLLAVKVLLEKGFDRIVCAGVPLTMEEGHFYRPKEKWESAKRFRRAWQIRVKMFDGRVRSMSGWTRELLGAPTEEWLGIGLRTGGDMPGSL